MFWQRRKREIFKYHDGRCTRYADPVAAIRALAAHPTVNLDEHLRNLESDQFELQNEASQIVVAAVREVFQLHAFDPRTGHGMTELETIDLLNNFMSYVDNLKKNGSGPAT